MLFVQQKWPGNKEIEQGKGRVLITSSDDPLVGAVPCALRLVAILKLITHLPVHGFCFDI